MCVIVRFYESMCVFVSLHDCLPVIFFCQCRVSVVMCVFI